MVRLHSQMRMICSIVAEKSVNSAKSIYKILKFSQFMTELIKE